MPFGNVDPHELFKGVFGANFNIFNDSMFEDMDWADGGGGGGGMGPRMNSFGSNHRRFSTASFPMGGHPFGNDMFVSMTPENAGRSKMPTVEYNLKLSLEELFTGTFFSRVFRRDQNCQSKSSELSRRRLELLENKDFRILGENEFVFVCQC